MKLPATLLQAMTLSVTLAVVAGSCHKNDVNSGTVLKEKEKKERSQKNYPDNCPACGRG